MKQKIAIAKHYIVHLTKQRHHIILKNFYHPEGCFGRGYLLSPGRNASGGKFPTRLISPPIAGETSPRGSLLGAVWSAFFSGKKTTQSCFVKHIIFFKIKSEDASNVRMSITYEDLHQLWNHELDESPNHAKFNLITI
jgi:hypothetical protein